MRTGFHMCSTIIASITILQPSFNQQHTPFTASILNVPVYNLMGLALTRRNETATPCVVKHSCAMLLSSRVRCVCLHIEKRNGFGVPDRSLVDLTIKLLPSESTLAPRQMHNVSLSVVLYTPPSLAVAIGHKANRDGSLTLLLTS